MFSEFLEASRGGNGSGTAFFVVFVERFSGGASSESEESQSLGSTAVGVWACDEGCRDEKSCAFLTGIVASFEFTTPSRPPEGPFFLLPPRPRPRALFAP